MSEPKRILLVGIYDTNTASLAPQLLAAIARDSAYRDIHTLETREFSIFTDTAESIAERITAWRPDVVCFSAYIWNIALIEQIAARLECTVVVGGPQVSDVEAELLDANPAIDIVATGEGEAAFLALLEYFAGDRALADVPGITTRELSTPPAAPMDLTHLSPIYERLFAAHPDVTWVSFETSRGCPMGCGYCTWGYSRKIRFMPLEYVFSELDVVLGNPRIGEIYLCDSSLLVNKKRALAILDHIIASGSAATIRYEFSPDQLDEQVIARMLRMPTSEFNFGIQTINPSALELIGRPFRRERFEKTYREFVSAFPKAQVTVDLIFGLPGDDLDGYVRSLDYAMSLPRVSRVLTNPLIVLPGSRFYRQRDELGIVISDDGSYIVRENATFSRDDMRSATRYSFYANILYLNSRFTDALLALAQERAAGPAELLMEFFESASLDFVEGDYPYTVPSVKEAFEHRNKVFGSAIRHYDEIISAFATFSGGRVDELLRGYETAYSTQYRKYLSYADRISAD